MKGIFLILSAGFVLVFVDLFGQVNNPTYYQKGIVALHRNDTSAAKKSFREAIGKHRDPASFNMLGKLLEKEGTFQSRFLALENYKEAALRAMGNYDYRLDYAKLLVQSNKKEGAAEFNKMVQAGVKRADLYVEMGNDYWKRGYEGYNSENYKDLFFDGAYDNYTMAEKCFIRALRIDNLSVEANIGLAQIYAFKSDYQKAIAILDNVCKFKPNIIDLNLLLGFYYFKLIRSNQALIILIKQYHL